MDAYGNYTVHEDDQNIIITIKKDVTPVPSKSGKMQFLATTSGWTGLPGVVLGGKSLKMYLMVGYKAR